MLPELRKKPINAAQRKLYCQVKSFTSFIDPSTPNR